MILLSLLTLGLSLGQDAHAVADSDLAEDMAPCGPNTISETIPAPLATDVPIDIVPSAMIVYGGCGGSAFTMSLRLDGEEVASAAHAAEDGLLMAVDPGADLAPDTTYVIEIVPAEGGETTSVGFTTGTGRAAPLDAAPRLIDLEAFVTRDGWVSVQASLVPASSADGESFVALAQEDSPETRLFAAHAIGTGDVFSYGNFRVDTMPDEVCMVATERDLAGSWSTSEAVCVAPKIVRDTGSGGCLDTTRGSPVAWISAGLALAALLRRGRRA